MRKLTIKVACLFFLLAGIQNALIAQDTTKLPPIKELMDQIDRYFKGQDTSNLPPLNELFDKLRMYKTAPDTTKLPSKKELVYNKELYPNAAAKGMMTPTGWGSTRSFVFGFIGATFPQVYTSKPDMIAAVGIGLGNAKKNVGVVSILNINNVSEFNTFSASLIVSRQLGKGTSISVGGLNMLASKRSDAGASFYVAVSHASQRIRPKIPGNARLNYTIGFGTERFLEKSPKDISTGKSKYGTGVFANISYEVIKRVNITAEWSGLNLGFAVGWKPHFGLPFKLPAINIGIADLTRSSGEKPRFVIGIGHSFSLSKK